MNKCKYLNLCIFVFWMTIFNISCTKDEHFIGYNDLIIDSPKLLWNSSIEDLSDKYPNAIRINENYFYENNPNEKVFSRIFSYSENKLYSVFVNYGNYNDLELENLKIHLKRNVGIYSTEDTISTEIWYLNTEKNKVYFVIDKTQNNTVNCQYSNSTLENKIFEKMFLEN